MSGRLRNPRLGRLPLWAALIITAFVLLFGFAAFLARGGASADLAQATATPSATARGTTTVTPTATATAPPAASTTGATTPVPTASAVATSAATATTTAATVAATALATAPPPTFGSGSSTTVGVNVSTSASSPSVTVPLGSVLPNSTLLTVTAPATLSGSITFNVTPSAAELAGVNGNIGSLEVIDVASSRRIPCSVAGDHLVCTAPGPGRFVVIATALSVTGGRGPAPISAPQQTAGNSGAGALAATPPALPPPIAQPQQTAGATGAGALAASPTPAVLQVPAPLAQPQQAAGSSGAGAVAAAPVSVAAPLQPVTTTAAAPAATSSAQPATVGLPPTGSGGLLAQRSRPDGLTPWLLLVALGLFGLGMLRLRRRL